MKSIKVLIQEIPKKTLLRADDLLWFVTLGSIRKNKAKNQKINKILLIKTDRIGDVVTSTPLIAALKKESGAKIDVLVHPSCAELLEKNPNINEIITLKQKWHDYNPKKPITGRFTNFASSFAFPVLMDREMKEKIRYIRSKKYDMIIDCAGKRRIALLSLILGSRAKSGFKIHLGSFAYDLRESMPATVKGINASERLLSLAELILGSKIDYGEYKTEIYISGNEIRKMKNALNKTPIGKKKIKIVIHPGSALGIKKWPSENFTKLANLLIKKYNAGIVLAGGKAETEDCKKIMRGIKKKSSAVDFSGQLSLRQLAALCKMCSLYIGNDTGTTHIAAASGINTIAIFGPVDYTCWAPWSRKAFVVTKNMGCSPCYEVGCKEVACMKGISVRDLMNASEKILK